MADRFVVDSHALLALFQDELGASQVQALLERTNEGDCELFMPVVNLGEALYIVERRLGLEAAQEALAIFDELPIEAVAVDRVLALSAARLKAATAVGYADCFVAALALQLGATVITGDPDFRRLEGAITVLWLSASGAA